MICGSPFRLGIPGSTIIKLFESENKLKYKNRYHVMSCVYYQIIEVILKDTLQRSDIDIINLLLFFDIIENNMAKSLRIFSSFMTVGPEHEM